jgi:hypothetical protein
MGWLIIAEIGHEDDGSSVRLVTNQSLFGTGGDPAPCDGRPERGSTAAVAGKSRGAASDAR